MEVLLPINLKNYNFREKSSQVMKEGEKEMKNLLPVIRHQKHEKQVCARMLIITTLNVIG